MRIIFIAPKIHFRAYSCTLVTQKMSGTEGAK